MSHKIRLQRLEGQKPAEGICILARAPASWTQEERTSAMLSYVADNSIPEPFTADIQDCREAKGLDVYWVGDLQKSLNRIADNPVRIGVP